LLFGNAVASSVCLLLNIHSVVVSIVAGVLLTPGGVLASVLFSASEITPPQAVLAGNAALYSAVALIGLVVLPNSLGVAAMRRVAAWLVAPTLLLISLACVPAFNRLWPRGLDQLSKNEDQLREALPVGMGLDQARAVMRSKGIDFREQAEASETTVLERGNTSITAEPGDRVMSARLETNASQFPCGYDIEVVLLFGRDEKMRSQYVHRLRLCP
jgi:hypothetical protein